MKKELELKDHKITSKFGDLFRQVSLAIVVTLLLSGQTVVAQDSLYQLGQKQLDNKDYKAARDTFAKLINVDEKDLQAQRQTLDGLEPVAKSKKDAALYWYAYSQFKNGHNQEALASISQLQRKHPSSRWLDDAAALRIEIQDKRGQEIEVDNEELKLYALNSLMNSPSEKSIEILKRLLAGNSSKQIKHRALFVLSQITDPQAFELIRSLAKDHSNKELQDEAIRALGVSGSEQAMAQLIDVYRTSENEATKMQILHSYMVAGQSTELIELAKSESNPDLKKQAIHLIGHMSNSDVLLEMYRGAEFKDFRSEILHALAIGDGAEALIEIVNSEKDQKLLVEAVQKTGINGNQATAKHLAKIYRDHDNREIRKAVIHAMFVQGDDKGLSNIIKSENDPVLKREALQKLSQLSSDDALQFFDDILNNEN